MSRQGTDGDSSMGVAACPGCLILENCVASGEANRDNACEVCDPARDDAGWSNNDGAACDDGLFCTIDDACLAGACGGAARACEDGIGCNGVSICLEEQDTCSAGENQCADLQLCDAVLDACVSTCAGCVVDGVCVAAGTAAANNSCLVCDPAQSTTSLSVTEGAPCGSAPTDCSAQDTCNTQGQCAPNHHPMGTICGPLGGQCDVDDTCNGSGQCKRRFAPNGASCEDGQFCTDGDRCQGGQCVPGAPRNCGQNRSCDEAQNICVDNRSGPGGPCSTNADCASGGCTAWFIDSDGDGFGSGEAIRACGNVPPDRRLLPNETLVLDQGDCCPSDPGTFPGFVLSPLLPAQTQRDACGSFDRDCSGREDNSLQDIVDVFGGGIESCETVSAGLCQSLVQRDQMPPTFVAWLGEVPPCGEFGTQIVCQLNANGACIALIGGPLDNRCH